MSGNAPRRASDARRLRTHDDESLLAATRAGGARAASAEARLVRRHQPLVATVVATLHADADVDHDDALACGNVGLLKAIRHFDPDRGVPFRSYARAKVQGEVLRWSRDNRYEARVPRPLHELSMRVRASWRDIERSGGDPTVLDVAADLGVPSTRVAEAVAVARAERCRVVELDAVRAAADDRAERTGRSILEAVGELDERLRLVLFRRYWEGRTQAEVGAELDVSQGHVSRLERRALTALRAELLGEPAPRQRTRHERAPRQQAVGHAA